MFFSYCLKNSFSVIMPTILSSVFSYTGIREYSSRRNFRRTSSVFSPSSTAVMRTRGVIISSTVISSNSRALRTRLLSCFSSTPSSSISSIMTLSSSSVMLTVSLPTTVS